MIFSSVEIFSILGSMIVISVRPRKVFLEDSAYDEPTTPSILNHPSVLTVGYTPVFHIHTAQVACQITKIVKTLNPATGETLKENPDFIKNGDAAIVEVKPVTPLVIEKQKEIPHMARFAIRDSGSTVAAGMCIDLKKKE